MSDDKLNDQDPAHHEGDQTEEMTEEGSPVEPESASSETDVIELGYRSGERMLRPAKVAVFVPAE